MYYISGWASSLLGLGCLIVEIHDHKTTQATVKETNADTTDGTKQVPFSIHNYNESITPSPYVPFPPRKRETQPRSDSIEPNKGNSSDQTDPPIKQESSTSGAETALPSQTSSVAKQPKIFTRVLHPTAQSRHRELSILATTPAPEPRNRRGGAAAREAATPATATLPTPLHAIPANSSHSRPGTAKRQKMQVEEKDMHDFEAIMLRSTEPPLFLEPAADFEDALSIMKSLAHPLHDHVPIKPQGRKRTHAELAADEAQAADEERTLLIMDERVRPSISAGTLRGGAATADGHAAAEDFQPTFARFKAFEDIRTRHQQEALEKLQREAKDRDEQKAQQQQLERQQKEQQDALRQEQLKQQQQLLQRHTQAQSMPQHMRTSNASMHQQMMQNLQAQQGQGQANSPLSQAQTPGPTSPDVASNGAAQNGGGMPMARNMSNQGGAGAGSPPRPPSAIPGQIRAGSVQPSHPSISRNGTPQVPQMTPLMPNGVPRGHMTPQHMNQGSPPPNGMQGTPMINMMGTPQLGQPTMQQQQAMLMNQQQQRRLAHAHGQSQAQAQTQPQAQMQGSPHMPNQNQISPQHAAMLQAQQQQQMANSLNIMQGTPTPGMNPQQAQAAALEYRRQAGAHTHARLMQLQRGQNPVQMPMQQPQQPNFSQGSPGMPFQGVPMAPSMSHNPSQQAQQVAQAQFISQQQAQQAAQQQQMGMHLQQQLGQNFVQQQAAQQQAVQQGGQPMLQLTTAQQQLLQRQELETRNAFLKRLAANNGGTLPPDAQRKWSEYLGVRRQQQMQQMRQMSLVNFQQNLQQAQQQLQQAGGPAVSPGQVLQNGMANANGLQAVNGMPNANMNTGMQQLAQFQYRQRLQAQSQKMGDAQRAMQQAQVHAQAQAQAMARLNGSQQGVDSQAMAQQLSQMGQMNGMMGMNGMQVPNGMVNGMQMPSGMSGGMPNGMPQMPQGIGNGMGNMGNMGNGMARPGG